ncbi:MAG: Calx-beta domain-containing protein, partial [Cyanobacteria bacterium J06639_1]
MDSGAGLVLIDSTFRNNSATGGNGGNGNSTSDDGQGRGGAIFVRSGGVLQQQNTTFDSNSAETADSDIAAFGSVSELEKPTITVTAGETAPSEAPVGERQIGVFAIALDSPFPLPLDIAYLLEGTAQSKDYRVSFEPSTVEFTESSFRIPPGVIEVTARVEAVDDDDFDPNETVEFLLTAAEEGDRYQVGTPNSATLTIADNEPEVSFAAASFGSVTEGETGSFVLNLTQPVRRRGGIVVRYEVGGSASGSSDYETLDPPASILIPEGEQTATINVSTFGDDLTEGDETIALTLLDSGAGDGYGASETARTATLTIADATPNFQTGTPGVRIRETGDSTDVVEDGTTDSYSVVLTDAPSDIVEISLASDLAQLQTSTSVLQFDASNWNVPQVVTVEAIADGLVETAAENTSSIAHTVSSADAGYDAIAVEDIAVSITDTVFDAADTAEGLERALEELQVIIERELLAVDLPIMGLLGDSAPGFIDSFKNEIVNAVATAKELTPESLQELLQGKLREIFPATEGGAGPKANVSIDSISTSEVSFNINIGETYELADFSLDADLGLPALGIEIDGRARSQFNYGLNLTFGINKNFGFFVDAGVDEDAGLKKTGLAANVDFSLSDDFSATGNLGF